ncbi:MAG: acyl-CoA thioesterase [Promethearchaeota archaeon]
MENEIINKLLKIKDSTLIKVRVDDTDLMGVVHFKNYLMYFDEGFVSFLNMITHNVATIVNKGIVFPVKRIEIIYEDSVKFGDNVIVKTNLKKIGNTSMTFTHNLYRESDNALLVKVECVRLVMENKTKKLFKITEFFKNYI